MSQQINLFNKQFVEKKAYFLFSDMLTGVVVVIAGCAVLTAYLYYQVHALTKAAAEATSHLSTSGEQLKQIKVQHAHRNKDQGLETQVQQTEKEVQALKSVLDVLKNGDIGNTEGYSAFLQALARQSMDGIWLTGFSIVGAGKEFELEGRVIKPELLPVYMNRLKAEPILQGKSFGTLEMGTTVAKSDAQSKPDLGIKADKTLVSVQSNTPAYIEFKLK
jgi:hypothetical protein